MPDSLKKPAHYLKQWRKHKGLTQTQLAGRINLDESNISRLETFKLRYTQETLELIAEAYDCDPADLLNPPPSQTKPESEFERYRRTLSEAQKTQAVAVLKAMFNRVA